MTTTLTPSLESPGRTVAASVREVTKTYGSVTPPSVP